MNRKITREEAVKILYTMDISNNYDTIMIQDYINHFSNESSEDLEFNIDAIDVEYLNKTLIECFLNSPEILVII